MVDMPLNETKPNLKHFLDPRKLTCQNLIKSSPLVLESICYMIGLVWFRESFNAKPILVEEQEWCYSIYIWWGIRGYTLFLRVLVYFLFCFMAYQSFSGHLTPN